MSRITREEMRQRWLRKKAGKAERAAEPEHEPAHLVEELEAQLAELPSAFRERASQEQDRRTAATDSRYWVALCFQTRQQKDEFLERLGPVDLGDIYLDGLSVAERLGVQIESPSPEWRDPPARKRLADLT